MRDVASRLQVAPSTLNRILQARSQVTPEMALQDAHDLWQARQYLELTSLQPLVEAPT